MVDAVAVGLPDVDFGTRDGFGGIGASVDVTRDLWRVAGQAGRVQIPVGQLRGVGDVVRTFGGPDGEAWAGRRARDVDTAPLVDVVVAPSVEVDLAPLAAVVEALPP